MSVQEELLKAAERLRALEKAKEETERWARLDANSPLTFEEENGQQLLYPRKCRVQSAPLISTALFRCSRRRERLNDVEIAAQGKWLIKLDGITFTQHDEIVFMELVNRANWAKSRTVRFSIRGLMIELGLSGLGGTGAQRIQDSLKRLSSTTVTLKDRTGRDDWGINGPLLSFAMWRKNPASGVREYVIELNKSWFWMLMEEGYTVVNWDTHKKLSVGLQTWMHRFVLRHRTSNGPKRESLSNLLAYTAMKGTLRNFRLQLKGAMEKLQEHGVVDHWAIVGRGQNAYLEFTKPLTATQKTKALLAGATEK